MLYCVVVVCVVLCKSGFTVVLLLCGIGEGCTRGVAELTSFVCVLLPLRVLIWAST